MQSPSSAHQPTRTQLTPSLPLPISGRSGAKVIALQPTTDPHVYTATRHDGLISRPMRLVTANTNLTQALAQARGQAYEVHDQQGQAVLYLGQRPGLRGGAPDRQPLNYAQWQYRMRAWASNPDNQQDGDLKKLKTALQHLEYAADNNDSSCDLRGLGLKALDTATFDQLSQLQTLYLRNNELSSLPASISQLSQLRTLSLSYNQFSALPSTLVQLSQLQTLYLHNNRLSVLPANISQLSQLQWLTSYLQPIKQLTYKY